MLKVLIKIECATQSSVNKFSAILEYRQCKSDNLDAVTIYSFSAPFERDSSVHTWKSFSIFWRSQSEVVSDAFCGLSRRFRWLPPSCLILYAAVEGAGSVLVIPLSVLVEARVNNSSRTSDSSLSRWYTLYERIAIERTVKAKCRTCGTTIEECLEAWLAMMFLSAMLKRTDLVNSVAFNNSQYGRDEILKSRGDFNSIQKWRGRSLGVLKGSNS